MRGADAGQAGKLRPSVPAVRVTGTSSLDRHPLCCTIPSPGDTTLTPRVAAFGRNQAEGCHELKGTGEASDVAEFGHLHRGCIRTRRGEAPGTEGQSILSVTTAGVRAVATIGQNNGAKAFLFRPCDLPRLRKSGSSWKCGGSGYA